MFAELALGPTVNLQHAVGRAVALKDDIHRASNAMFEKKLRCPKPLFILKVIGDDRLTGVQGEPRWRFEIGADRRHADNTFIPADARADQESIVRRDVLQHLAELRLHSLGGKTRGVIQQIDKRRALECEDPQFREDLLLANAELQ